MVEPSARQRPLPPRLRDPPLLHRPQTVELARTVLPDVVIADVGLPEAGGVVVCRELRAGDLVPPSTAVLLISPGVVTRQQRLEALRAGASELIGLPAPATPLPPDQFGGMVILDVDVAPGQGEAFNEASRAMNKAMTDLKYPYARNLYRVRMGEGRTQIYTFIDNRENYYGKNSVQRLMEANPAAAGALRTAYEAMLKTVSHMESGWAGYARDLSYPPPL